MYYAVNQFLLKRIKVLCQMKHVYKFDRVKWRVWDVSLHFSSWDSATKCHLCEQYRQKHIHLMGCPTNQPTVIQHNVEYSAIVRSRSSQAERKVNSVSSIHFNLTGLVVEKSSKSKFWPTTSVGMVRQVRSSLRKKISKVSNILNRFFRSFWFLNQKNSFCFSVNWRIL